MLIPLLRFNDDPKVIQDISKKSYGGLSNQAA
jgi:hypothetical protein